MPSISETARLLRAVQEDAIEAARKDGEHTALVMATHTVDMLAARAKTIEEFRELWGHTKAVYEEHERPLA